MQIKTCNLLPCVIYYLDKIKRFSYNNQILFYLTLRESTFCLTTTPHCGA